MHLVAFAVRAFTPISITVSFFAEDERCPLLPATRVHSIPPITYDFREGVLQKFRVPIDLSNFEEAELLKGGDMDPYSFSIKLEESLDNQTEDHNSGKVGTSQITHFVFEREGGNLKAKAAAQYFWYNGKKYKVRNIYLAERQGTTRKECVVCLHRPRDSMAVPCYHLCVCRACRDKLRFRKYECGPKEGLKDDRCPYCKEPVQVYCEMPIADLKELGDSSSELIYYYPYCNI